MDIKNAKSLNANTYDFISIGKCISVNQDRNIWGNSNIRDNLTLNPVGVKFTSTLKGLTDEEKMNEIIRYFLRNNIICEVTYEVYNRVGYTAIKGLEDRSLRISEMHKLSEDILHEIYEKYYLDRGKIIEKSPCNNYIFGCADWCSTEILIPQDYYFMIPPLMHNKDCINITFEFNENGEINDNDKIVFNQILDEIMRDVSHISGCYQNYYIIEKKDGSTIQLLLFSDSKEYMKDVIYEYIKNIKNENNAKSLQKKMEGF